MIYKRGDVYWYKFMWHSEMIRESTKQGNDKVARQMESAHRTSLAKGEVGLRDSKPSITLVEFIDNPKHRRSRLVRLTRKGDARYRKLNAKFLSLASTMGVDLSEADIRRTSEIVARLSDDVKAHSQASVR